MTITCTSRNHHPSAKLSIIALLSKAAARESQASSALACPFDHPKLSVNFFMSKSGSEGPKSSAHFSRGPSRSKSVCTSGTVADWADSSVRSPMNPALALCGPMRHPVGPVSCFAVESRDIGVPFSLSAAAGNPPTFRRISPIWEPINAKAVF